MTYLFRSKNEEERYCQQAQILLQNIWRDKYHMNLAIVKKFIANKLTEAERAALEKHKNDDGFLIGTDPKYILTFFERAMKELSELEKAEAICH